MKLIIKTLFSFILIICIISCKSDKKQLKIENEKPIDNQNSESAKHLQNVARAHNAEKFKSEEQVKFNLEFSTADEVMFNGTITLKTDGAKARFLDSKVNQVIEKNNLNSNSDQKLFFLAEIYATGFWFDQDTFKKIKSQDSEFFKATYTSFSQTAYTIYTHPLTDIVQHLDYNTKISEEPFNKGTIYFEKYITVNRVPVPLIWTFKSGDDITAQAKISRISYPKNF